MRPRTRQLLNDLLENNIPDEGALAAWLSNPPVEDQWLDYKAGAIMSDSKKAARVVREYISGFANAEGGALIIGFDHRKKKLDGAKAPGASTLQEWAASALAPLPALPAPRIVAVRVSGVDVLLLAVTRSRSLIYTIEEGEPAYYLRFGDSTRKAPSYLIADLMLGRRVEPELRVSLRSVEAGTPPADVRPEVNPNIDPLSLYLTVQYENVGLPFAESVRCGLVCWSLSSSHRVPRSLPSSILRMVDLSGPPEPWTAGTPSPAWMPVYIAQSNLPGQLVGPFEALPSEIRGWTVPLFRNMLDVALPMPDPASPRYNIFAPDVARSRSHARGALQLEAALCVVAKGTEPWWHQVTVRYDWASMSRPENRHQLFEIEAVGHERPKVAVAFLPESWQP